MGEFCLQVGKFCFGLVTIELRVYRHIKEEER